MFAHLIRTLFLTAQSAILLFTISTISYRVSATECLVPPPGLISWWPGDGNAQDIVGSNHGTLRGDMEFAQGVVGQGFSLDGVDDFVLVPDSSDLNITGDVTVDFWAQRIGTIDTAIMVTKGASIIDGIDVPTSYGVHFFSGRGQLTGGFERDDGSNVLLAGPFVNDLDFRHYAYVRRGDTHKLFVNGSIVGSMNFTGSPGDTTGLPLTIGAGRGDDFGVTGFTRHFAGVIDELEVFNRALEDSEIQALFASGSAGKCKGLASVEIDIKPFSGLNPVNPMSRGLIPVAILTTDTFDALQVDFETLMFGPGMASEHHGRAHIQDVDGDGDPDMLLHFRTMETGIVCGTTEAVLKGETFVGDSFTAKDNIRTVGCKKMNKVDTKAIK